MILFPHASEPMRNTLKLLVLSLAVAVFAGCSFFRVEIQQGNYITQEQVQKLHQGMTMREVRYVMGTPLVVDPFHEKNRWDYIYAYSPDLGTDFEKRRLTLFFKDEKLDRITGDIGGTDLAQAYQETGGTRVTTPTEASEEGFFKRTLDKILRRDN